MSLVLAGLCAFVGNILIYSGLAFINADLLPHYFERIYAQTSNMARLIVMSLLFSTLANYLFAKVYQFTDTANASMLILGSVVCVMIAKSLLIENEQLNIRILISALCLIGCAVWVSYELHAGK